MADLICGNAGTTANPSPFRYRSSSYLTAFFQDCGLPYAHDGSTRAAWVLSVLQEINEKPTRDVSLPSDELLSVFTELIDPVHFDNEPNDRLSALSELNKLLKRDGLSAFVDDERGMCHIKSVAGATSAIDVKKRVWSRDEKEKRERFATYLKSASEDDFTSEVLLPLFRALGYVRISLAGHRDKTLEFGKDLWMKYRLPTSHWLYFGSQVKVGNINSAASGGNDNVETVLTQTRMMFTDPIFDPETNRKNLLDHVYIIASGEITKAARRYLAQHLDSERRRQIIFMDRDEILDLCVDLGLGVPGEAGDEQEPEFEIDVPF
jgi:hypothetical protein